MIRLMHNVNLTNRLRTDDFTIEKCVQNRRLCWFRHIKRISFWVCRYRAVKVSGTVHMRK